MDSASQAERLALHGPVAGPGRHLPGSIGRRRSFSGAAPSDCPPGRWRQAGGCPAEAACAVVSVSSGPTLRGSHPAPHNPHLPTQAPLSTQSSFRRGCWKAQARAGRCTDDARVTYDHHHQRGVLPRGVAEFPHVQMWHHARSQHRCPPGTQHPEITGLYPPFSPNTNYICRTWC